jgi:hypothetical protein
MAFVSIRHFISVKTKIESMVTPQTGGKNIGKTDGQVHDEMEERLVELGLFTE